MNGKLYIFIIKQLVNEEIILNYFVVGKCLKASTYSLFFFLLIQ